MIAPAKTPTQLLRNVQWRPVGETPALSMPPAFLRTSVTPLALPFFTTKPSSRASSAPMITWPADVPAPRPLAASMMAMFGLYRASDRWVSPPANPPYNDTPVCITSEPVAPAVRTSFRHFDYLIRVRHFARCPMPGIRKEECDAKEAKRLPHTEGHNHNMSMGDHAYG